jgi:hypothetical protein
LELSWIRSLIGKLIWKIGYTIVVSPMLEKSAAEKCSASALSPTTDDVLGNYFGGYIDVATLTIIHERTRGHTCG